MVNLTLEKLVGELEENPDPNDSIKEMILEQLPDDFIDPKMDDNEDDLTETEIQKKKLIRKREKERSEEYSKKAKEFIDSPEGKKALDYITEQRLNIIYDGIYTLDFWKGKKMTDSVKSYRKRFKKNMCEDLNKLRPENLYEYLNDIYFFFIYTDDERENLIQKANREKEFYKQKYEEAYNSKKWDNIQEIRNDVLKEVYDMNQKKLDKLEWYRREFNKYKNIVIQMEYDRMEQKAHWCQYGSGAGSKSQDDLVDELLKKKKKEQKREKKKAAQKKHEKMMKELDSSSDESDSD